MNSKKEYSTFFREQFQTLFKSEDIKDFEQGYQKTFGSFRNTTALYAYLRSVNKLPSEQGKLVSIEEVQGVLGDVLGSVRSRILAIPTRLAARLAGTQDAKKVKTILDKSVESALTDVSTLDLANITEKRRK